MKKYLLLSLLLLSCESRDEVLDRISRRTLTSAFSTLHSSISVQQHWDKSLNQLILTKEEEKDSIYSKLVFDYQKTKLDIYLIDTQKVKSRYETIHNKDSDLGLEFASEFDEHAYEMEIKIVKSYFLLYKRKQEIMICTLRLIQSVIFDA